MTNFRMRKNIRVMVARLLILFVILISRVSYALPLVALAYSASGVIVEMNLGTAISSALGLLGVGAAFSYFEFTDNSQVPPQKVRVPLTASINIPSPTAPGTAPASTAQQYSYTFGTHTFSNVDPILACEALSIAVYPCSEGAGVDWVDPVTHTCNFQDTCNPQSVEDHVQPTMVAAACPSGYIQGSGGCVLNDSRLVTPDSTVDYQRNPDGTLTPLPDADVVTGLQFTPQPDGSLKLVGSNNSGYPATVNIQPTSSGGSVVTINSQSESNGSTFVDTTQLNIDSTGTLTNATSSSSGGSISLDGAIGGSGGGSGGSGTSPVKFPSDYARSGEAAAAAQSINTNIDGHLNNSEGVADPTDLTGADSPGYGITFDSIKNWTVPTHTSTCPQPSMDLSMVLGAGSVYTMTAHCQLVQDNFATLRAAMLVCWAIAALFVVLRA